MQGDATTDSGKPGRLRLASVVADLPPGFDVLRAEARAEGHLFLERLADDWQSRTVRFDREGEALLVAFCEEVIEVIAGIGGLTIEPVVPNALRMRRFYVRAPFRRRGIGRRLVAALLERVRHTGRSITVNAAPDSARFWETLGFKPDRRDGHTHILDPNEL
jgi:GNAT superfamily N-acetyltransferase